ncbi:sorting nexin-21 [Lingula anatina]|uniref:Sorting nexin-21 n=1 Tax=Lingula anatina TaxID=7574 RepID=A0A1S3K4T5_LINAN|nr:sorting nexin-21 [Lingula anatina]|eukprot:XP_013417645.1 sorting nexin-21 [Lingula anatina]
MSSKLKKLGANIDIDNTLSAEGEDSELSLVDDSEVLSDALQGKLSFTGDNANGNANDSPTSTNTGSSRAPVAPPLSTVLYTPDHNSKPSPAQVAFEILRTKTIKDGRSRYVLYTVAIIRTHQFDTSQATVDKRYSDFEKLYNSLRKRLTAQMQEIAFPKKVLTGNFDDKTIAHRSRAFEQFLSHVYAIPELRESEELHNFFFKVDLDKALLYLRNGEYLESIPLLLNALNMQQKLLGDSHPDVLKTVCAIIVAYNMREEHSNAQKFADMALKLIGEDSSSRYLMPVLQLNIRLCWVLGKEKADLEEKLADLHEKGLEMPSPDRLLEMVVQ